MRNYIESADTTALGRALARAGFGANFVVEGDSEPDEGLIDSPVSIKTPAQTSPVNTFATSPYRNEETEDAAPTEKPEKKPTANRQPKKKAPAKEAVTSAVEVEEPLEGQMNFDTPKEIPEAVEEPAPAEEAVPAQASPMTVEDAKKVTLTTTRYKGETLETIMGMTIGKRVLLMAAAGAKGATPAEQEAAKLLLDYYFPGWNAAA